MLVELEWVDHHRIYEQFTFGISSHSNGKVLPSQVEDGTTHVKTYYKHTTTPLQFGSLCFHSLLVG